MAREKLHNTTQQPRQQQSFDLSSALTRASRGGMGGRGADALGVQCIPQRGSRNQHRGCYKTQLVQGRAGRTCENCFDARAPRRGARAHTHNHTRTHARARACAHTRTHTHLNRTRRGRRARGGPTRPAGPSGARRAARRTPRRCYRFTCHVHLLHFLYFPPPTYLKRKPRRGRPATGSHGVRGKRRVATARVPLCAQMQLRLHPPTHTHTHTHSRTPTPAWHNMHGRARRTQRSNETHLTTKTCAD